MGQQLAADISLLNKVLCTVIQLKQQEEKNKKEHIVKHTTVMKQAATNRNMKRPGQLMMDVPRLTRRQQIKIRFKT